MTTPPPTDTDDATNTCGHDAGGVRTGMAGKALAMSRNATTNPETKSRYIARAQVHALLDIADAIRASRPPEGDTAMASSIGTATIKFDIRGNLASELRSVADSLVPPAPIDRDELKAVIVSCGPDPAAAEVADAVAAWLNGDKFPWVGVPT